VPVVPAALIAPELPPVAEVEPPLEPVTCIIPPLEDPVTAPPVELPPLLEI
jgi:hypothetical protein